MKPIYRGIAVAILQSLIVLSTYGKYSLDRDRLPRAWAKSAPVDPNLPIRGRYLRLRLEVETPAEAGQGYSTGRLTVRDGRLFVEPDTTGYFAGHTAVIRNTRTGKATLSEPVAFFLPEHAPDPSILPSGKELWVEVSVPPKGPPRPIRLEVR